VSKADCDDPSREVPCAAAGRCMLSTYPAKSNRGLRAIHVSANRSRTSRDATRGQWYLKRTKDGTSVMPSHCSWDFYRRKVWTSAVRSGNVRLHSHRESTGDRYRHLRRIISWWRRTLFAGFTVKCPRRRKQRRRTGEVGRWLRDADGERPIPVPIVCTWNVPTTPRDRQMQPPQSTWTLDSTKSSAPRLRLLELPEAQTSTSQRLHNGGRKVRRRSPLSQLRTWRAQAKSLPHRELHLRTEFVRREAAPGVRQRTSAIGRG